MKYSTLLLDLDDTLYPYAPNHQRALQVVAQFCSEELPLSKDDFFHYYAKANAQVKQRLANRAASHHRLLYFQALCEQLNYNAFALAPRLDQLYWETFLSKIELFSGVKAFLEWCQQEKLMICCLTDLVAKVQFDKIERLQLGGYFKHLVTSEEVGQEKPHPSMFYHALFKTGCTSEQALMIGDSFSKDILGANALGITSIWLNHKKVPQELPQGVTMVNAFSEVMERLL